MKNKSRIFPIVCLCVAVAAVTALVTVLILTMWGKDNGDSDKDTPSYSDTKISDGIALTIPETEPPVETAPPETEAPETEPQTSPPETEPPETEPQTTPPEINETNSIRSTISGNTLKSDTFKIQATLGDDWTFGSDSDVADLNGMTGTSAADFEKAYKENNMFYDSLAKTSTGSNFIVVIPNPDKFGSIAASEKAYAEATLEGIKNIDSSAKVSTVTFAGKSHSAIKVTNNSMGMTFEQCMVFVKSGRNICMITFTCFSDEELEEVMGWFTGLE